MVLHAFIAAIRSSDVVYGKMMLEVCKELKIEIDLIVSKEIRALDALGVEHHSTKGAWVARR